MLVAPTASDHIGDVLRRPRFQQASSDRLTLRQRCEADSAGLAALFSQEDFQRNGWTWDPIETEAGQAQLQWQWASAFEVVAHRGGDTIGFAGVYPQGGRQGHTGSLTLCVHESHQRQGVGATLMTSVIATAWIMMGLSRLQLTVFTDNARAIRLYERFRFVKEGRIRHFAWRADGFVDAYLMSLLRSEG